MKIFFVGVVLKALEKKMKDGQIASGRHLGKLLTFLSPLALCTQCVIHTLCMFQSELNNQYLLKYFLEQKQITDTKRRRYR